MDFTKTDLFRRTLGEQAEDEHAEPRTYLREALFKFRERAATLAAEIHRDLPQFTVHDITHLDTLWEMADLIGGQDYPLTPLEGFALGGAFLLHDLGLGLAAWPGGLAELKDSVGWRDTLSAHLRKELGRAPTPDELEAPPPEVELAAVEERLRSLHAEHAERLALTSWKDPRGGSEYHLIEDPDLRDSLGPVLGRIAHSHWWPVDRLASEFETTLGARHPCPQNWTLDPLTVAVLLRTADAANLDSRRAPGFLRALRRPEGFSREHWIFQERLHKPRLEEDRLVFTTARPFLPKNADAWWLCLETLLMVDRELGQVDSLLADLKKPRLQARGVAGVESPERLRKLVAISGWSPVDARIHISNVAELVERLGGEQLYGDDPTVPLRELIQNAADAVRARRLLEDRDSKWGRVTVRLGKDDRGTWIEVEDTGIGMSEAVLSGSLLDFGTTYWGSALMREEHEGLWAKSFEPAGKFGIGFFSVFMWGRAVQVVSRRFEAAKAETRVLEFRTGVEGRPLLRWAQPSEQLRDGGSRVRVWLNKRVEETWDLLNPDVRTSEEERPAELGPLCAWLAPALDIDLWVHDADGSRCVVAASDWLTLEEEQLLRRLTANRRWRKPFGDLAYLHPITDPNRGVVGRATICLPGPAVLTVGGLRAGMSSSASGLLLGSGGRAARDRASLAASPEVLSTWASEQVARAAAQWAISFESTRLQVIVAQKRALPESSTESVAVRFLMLFQVLSLILGHLPVPGSAASLPIAKRGEQSVSFRDLADVFCNTGGDGLLCEMYKLRSVHDF